TEELMCIALSNMIMVVEEKQPLISNEYDFNNDRATPNTCLQSRYYDPQWGRFINADGVASTGQGLIGTNMYAYCNNNPINMSDPTGHLAVFGIIAGIGALVGVGLQFASDVISSVANNKFQLSNWQTYVGSAVGGAVGGLVTMGAKSPQAGVMIGSGTATLVGQTIENKTKSGTKRPTSTVLTNTAISVATAGLISKVVPVKISGITANSGNMNAVYNAGITKLLTGYASTMSINVILKGITASFITELPSAVFSGFYSFFENQNSKEKNTIVWDPQ
ncbi:MAG: RHS repeat-associated core domain-containing protein, partial [Oscillospiraceae bacterium]|nr:RHS repeat-associated core domain-containing protein [Oscillospiraceae bacterium]